MPDVDVGQQQQDQDDQAGPNELEYPVGAGGDPFRGDALVQGKYDLASVEGG